MGEGVFQLHRAGLRGSLGRSSGTTRELWSIHCQSPSYEPLEPIQGQSGGGIERTRFTPCARNQLFRVDVFLDDLRTTNRFLKVAIAGSTT